MAQVTNDKDAPLDDDIRLLGRLLGDVVRDQHGAATYELVERIRRLAVGQRRRHSDDHGELASLLHGLSTDQAIPVIRAFSWFSLLANIAEDVHHVRRRSFHRRAGSAAQPGSLVHALDRLRADGYDANQTSDLLQRLCVSPVLTAHPTEVRRKTVLDAQLEIARLLLERDRLDHDHEDEAEVEDNLRLQILILWQTAILRLAKLRVGDEINESLRYYPLSLFDGIVALHQDLEREVVNRWPELAGWHATPVIRMGSWIGGDRDGNPFVTADVLHSAVHAQCTMALQHHLRALHRLSIGLSMSSRLVNPTDALLVLAAAGNDHSPFRQDEPYRQAMRGMHARLSATAHGILGTTDDAPSHPVRAYNSTTELMDDLDVVAHSLCSHGAAPIARAQVEPVRRAVELFGFHLCALDLRQNSDVHERVVAELLATACVHPHYLSLSEAERVAVLDAELSSPRPLRVPTTLSSPLLADELAILETAAAAIRRLGPGAIPQYVISKCDSVSDVLEVAILLREVGLLRINSHGGYELDIDIVPLFETIGDLTAGGGTLNAMLNQPRYRALVAARHHRQEVMIGYSDSTKDGGYLAANWALYNGEAALLTAAQSHQVHLRLFHGRGGTVGRGGGPSYEAILAQPHGCVDGELRITEQGEVVAAKFADKDLARRNLESLVAATLEATAFDTEQLGSDGPGFGAIVEALAGLAYQEYRSLVYETPGFLEVFRLITPIAELAALNIGSRPTSRTASTRIEDLRAIPWVFSWSQSRIMLPGWYGSGTAFQRWAGADTSRADDLRTLYARWPFFRTVLSNMGMVLAKTDIAIARRYGELVAHNPTGTAVLERIINEHTLTVQWLETITGQALLADNPSLARSIANRFAYLDPLNHLQVTLLDRYRAGDTDPLLQRAIHLTINGLATGLRNSG